MLLKKISCLNKYAFVVSLIVLILVVILFKNTLKKSTMNPSIPPEKYYTYNCEKGKSIIAIYKDKKVSIKLSDQRTFVFNQTMSASGVRFANSDESIVFWNKGNSAFLEENGNTTYINCIEATR